MDTVDAQPDSLASTPGGSPTMVVEKQAQRRIFKIIVIGDSNVGKTCLTFRFCGGKFPDKTEATIGVDFREKTIDVDTETIKVDQKGIENELIYYIIWILINVDSMSLAHYC